MSCHPLRLAIAALEGSSFARDQFQHRYGVPAAAWTAEPTPEPEPVARRPERPPARQRDRVPGARIAAALDALECGEQDLAVQILLDLEADWQLAA